jgi:hypothetical protein
MAYGVVPEKSDLLRVSYVRVLFCRVGKLVILLKCKFLRDRRPLTILFTSLVYRESISWLLRSFCACVRLVPRRLDGMYSNSCK